MSPAIDPSQSDYTVEAAVQELGIWYQLREQLQSLQAQEVLLRERITRRIFPDPKEGTNKYALNGGYELVMDHRIGRTVDQAAFEALKAKLRKAKVKVDELVKYDPRLAIGEYRKLTAEQRKVFDECITSKPGLPGLTIKSPKAAKDEGT